MKVYIARQPILNRNKKTVAYELLYRDSKENRFRVGTNLDYASKSVIADAIDTFGITKVTKGTIAYINFTRELILNGFAYYLNPDDVVIELLENIVVDALLVDKVKELYEEGYTLALDDYIGSHRFDSIMEYITIIKVDFMQTEPHKRKSIAKKFKNRHKTLLAEKVETQEEVDEAMEWGYHLFQGYFFARPSVKEKRHIRISTHSYMQIVKELRKDVANFDKITNTIQADVILVYKLLRLVNCAYFYRGHRINSVKSAVVMLGTTELYRWIMLIMIHDVSHNRHPELFKTALIRARFAESLACEMKLDATGDDAYFTGMFSLIDIIVETELEEVLCDLALSKEVKDALIYKESDLAEIVTLIEAYEKADWKTVANLVKPYDIKEELITEMYSEALRYADLIFYG